MFISELILNDALSRKCTSRVYYTPTAAKASDQGDPFDTSVLLWTRAFPINGTPDQSVPVCVSFKIFDNPGLKGRPIDSGEAFTSWDVDFTVKVEATGLKAESSYWYQFADCTAPNSTSVVGATRTLPHPNSTLRFQCSCSPKYTYPSRT